MRFLFRLIPFVIGLVTLILFLLIGGFPTQIGRIVFVAMIIIAWLLWELFGRSFVSSDFWGSIALLLAFVAGAIGLFLLVEGTMARTLLAIGVATLSTLLIEYLYRWFYGERGVPSTSLVVMTRLVELATVFAVSATAFGLRIFLRIPILPLLGLSFGLFVAILTLVGQWHRGTVKKQWMPALVCGLLGGELMVAISYLPTAFLVGAGFVTVPWYVGTGMLRMAQTGTWSHRACLRYLVLGACTIVLIALTARWT